MTNNQLKNDLISIRSKQINLKSDTDNFSSLFAMISTKDANDGNIPIASFIYSTNMPIKGAVYEKLNQSTVVKDLMIVAAKFFLQEDMHYSISTPIYNHQGEERIEYMDLFFYKDKSDSTLEVLNKYIHTLKNKVTELNPQSARSLEDDLDLMMNSLLQGDKEDYSKVFSAFEHNEIDVPSNEVMLNMERYINKILPHFTEQNI